MYKSSQSSHTVREWVKDRIYSSILENQYLISSEFEPRSLLDLQLFFDEANCNVWIVGITVKTVLDLAKRAKEIYASSKVEEERQILEFLVFELGNER